MTAFNIGSQTAKRIINIGAEDEFDIGETNENETTEQDDEGD